MLGRSSNVNEDASSMGNGSGVNQSQSPLGSEMRPLLSNLATTNTDAAGKIPSTSDARSFTGNPELLSSSPTKAPWLTPTGSSAAQFRPGKIEPLLSTIPGRPSGDPSRPIERLIDPKDLPPLRKLSDVGKGRGPIPTANDVDELEEGEIRDEPPVQESNGTLNNGKTSEGLVESASNVLSNEVANDMNQNRSPKVEPDSDRQEVVVQQVVANQPVEEEKPLEQAPVVDQSGAESDIMDESTQPHDNVLRSENGDEGIHRAGVKRPYEEQNIVEEPAIKRVETVDSEGGPVQNVSEEQESEESKPSEPTTLASKNELEGNERPPADESTLIVGNISSVMPAEEKPKQAAEGPFSQNTESSPKNEVALETQSRPTEVTQAVSTGAVGPDIGSTSESSPIPTTAESVKQPDADGVSGRISRKSPIKPVKSTSVSSKHSSVSRSSSSGTGAGAAAPSQATGATNAANATADAQWQQAMLAQQYAYMQQILMQQGLSLEQANALIQQGLTPAHLQMMMQGQSIGAMPTGQGLPQQQGQQQAGYSAQQQKQMQAMQQQQQQMMQQQEHQQQQQMLAAMHQQQQQQEQQQQHEKQMMALQEQQMLAMQQQHQQQQQHLASAMQQQSQSQQPQVPNGTSASTAAAVNAMLSMHQQHLPTGYGQMPTGQPGQGQAQAGAQGVSRPGSQVGTATSAAPGMEVHGQMLLYLMSTNPQLIPAYLQQTGLNPQTAQALLQEAMIAQNMLAAGMMPQQQQPQQQSQQQQQPLATKQPQQQQQPSGVPAASTSVATSKRATSPVPDGSTGRKRSQSPTRMSIAPIDTQEEPKASIQAYLSAVSRPQPTAQPALMENVLCDAVVKGDPGFLRALLPQHTHLINAVNTQGSTPLIVASSLTNPEAAVECVRLLLTFGASGRVRDRQGLTAAHWAAMRDNVDALRAILTNDRQLVDAPCSRKGDTPLHKAARMGKAKSIKLLITEFSAIPLSLNLEYETVIEVAGKTLADDGITNLQINNTSRIAARNALFEAAPYTRTLVVCHNDCLLHETTDSHQESPERIRAIFKELNDSEGASGLVVSDDFAKAPLEAVARAHDPEYIQFVVDLEAQLKREKAAGPVAFTPRVQKEVLGVTRVKEDKVCDTMFSAESLGAALRAAGAVIRAVDVVVNGYSRNAFCCVRPPGHHAGTKGLLDDAMSCGFCIFNSVMVGAMHALSTYPTQIRRIAIIDFDVHHGNGTQDIIKQKVAPYSKDAVLFVSIHLFDREEDPARDARDAGQVVVDTDSNALPMATTGRTEFEFYPGSGSQDIWDKNIFNIPITPLWKPQADPSPTHASAATTRAKSASLQQEAASVTPPYIGRLAYRRAVREKLIPLLRAYRPDLILVSAGFDAGVNDAGCCKVSEMGAPSTGLDLRPEDFDYMTKLIIKVANVCCGGRVVSCLEGGYGCAKMPEKPGETFGYDRGPFAKCVAAHVLGLSGMSSVLSSSQ